MKYKFNLILILILLVTVPVMAADKLIRDIQIKEGARKILSLDVASYLEQDPSIAKLLKTDTVDQIVILGLSMGKTEIVCKDKNNNDTLLKVTVVPRYWDTLEYLFGENPNISLSITEGHLIISGKVIQNSLLKKVDEAVNLDKKRIINNVAFSHEDLIKRIQSYLKTEDYDFVKAECMDRTVYLSGNIFDKKKRDNLISVVESYAKPAGCTLNSSGIHLNGSPLTVEVRFVSIDRGKNDNVGLTLEDIKYTMDSAPNAAIGYTKGGTPNVTKTSTVPVEGTVNTNGTINLTKKKSALKVLYATNLSTRSGELAKLQRGGTLYEKIEGVQAVSIKEIDYGFIVEITPTLLNKDTIDADVKIQVSQPTEGSTPLKVTKYTMNAKYTVAPGEIILINKINHINDNVTKQGLPILSDIPIISYLFENETAVDSNTNLLLLLRISFQPKDEMVKEAETANKHFIKAQNTPTHVDMNFFESLVDELEDAIEKEEEIIEKKIE